jgi:hypothetical protein
MAPRVRAGRQKAQHRPMAQPPRPVIPPDQAPPGRHRQPPLRKASARHMTPRIRAGDRTARHRPKPQPPRPADPTGPRATGAASPTPAPERLGAAYVPTRQGRGSEGTARANATTTAPRWSDRAARHRGGIASTRSGRLGRICPHASGPGIGQHGTGRSHNHRASVIPPGRAPPGRHRQHSFLKAGAHMPPRIRADDRKARHRPKPQPPRPADPAGPGGPGRAA